MLKLQLNPLDVYDEETNQFITIAGGNFTFEHSLYTIAIWEGKYHKPFLSREVKTPEELYDYVKMMCHQEDFEIAMLDSEALETISDYMNANHTATTIESDNSPSNKILTAEVLYAYMFNQQIDISMEHWHISRYMKLLAVMGELSKPEKKMTSQEIRERNRELNKQRQKQYNTKG